MKTCDAIWTLNDSAENLRDKGYGTLSSDDLLAIAASYRKLAEREKALTEALEAMREYVVAQKGLADYPLIADAALALHKEDA